MRTCTKCGEMKPLSEFHRQRRGRDGLMARCKTCHRQMMQVSRARRTPEDRARSQQAANARRRRRYATDLEYRAACAAKNQRFRATPNSREARRRRYVQNSQNPEWMEQRRRHRRDKFASDPVFRAGVKGRVQRRKARIKGVQHEPYSFVEICLRYDHTCYLCGNQPDRLSPEHVIPISRGGPDAGWNVLPSCFSCNMSKGDRLLSELDREPAISPDDLRLWVVLAPEERWSA